MPDFTLTLITQDPAWAAAADGAGVDRVGVDIERLGKQARQGHIPDARISGHTLDDLVPIASAVERARVFARLNPPHDGTAAEVERAIENGANALMLPHFRAVDEAAQFVEVVGGRAEVLLLVETAEALDAVESLVVLPGVDELMVGLNDLSQSLGLAHPMALATSPHLDHVARCARKAGLAFGFGGVAGPDGDPGLPVQPDLLLARYAQLGARAAWVSRTFVNGVTPETFGPALERLRARLAWWFEQAEAGRAAALAKLDEQVRALTADRSALR